MKPARRKEAVPRRRWRRGGAGVSAGGGNPAQRAARKRAGAREKDAERDPEAGGEERGTGSKVGGRRRGRGGEGVGLTRERRRVVCERGGSEAGRQWNQGVS